MNIYLGIVSSVRDDKKFVIDATIPGQLDNNCIPY